MAIRVSYISNKQLKRLDFLQFYHIVEGSLVHIYLESPNTLYPFLFKRNLKFVWNNICSDVDPFLGGGGGELRLKL